MPGPFGRKILIPFAILLTMIIIFSNHFTPTSRVRKLVHVDSALRSSAKPESFRAPAPRTFGKSTNDYTLAKHGIADDSSTARKVLDVSKSTLSTIFANLTQCHQLPNKYTNHIRLPNMLHNISMDSFSSSSSVEERKYWNPTIIALPSWAKNQYIVISTVHLADAGYRQNVLCEANICYGTDNNSHHPDDRACFASDDEHLARAGTMICSAAPVVLQVPATAAKSCQGKFASLADIPGFHDGRLSYSSRGEPLLMFASQSRYACIGVWLVDLRVIHPPLHDILNSSPKLLGPGPLVSYSEITELTRNPPETRMQYEKNWMIFSLRPGSSYLHYDLNPHRRTFAKLVGGGFATPNLTDPLEPSCLQDLDSDGIYANTTRTDGTWHQSSPALKLELCNRMDSKCHAKQTGNVFFAIVHRKYENMYQLPLRYERYIVVWSASAPFSMLAVSRHPILMANETTAGWSARETWDDVPEAAEEGRGHWAGWTYTTTIAYTWRRREKDPAENNSGFLDDEVVLSVGVDDEGQVYGRVKIYELLQCLRLCPRGA